MVAWPLIVAAALVAACGSRDDRGQDAAADVEDAGDQAESVDAPQDEAEEAGDAVEEDAAQDCTMPSAEEQAALDADVNAYIVGEDDTLPGRLASGYPDLCFEALAAAIRSRPAADPATGVIATSFPYGGSAATLHLYVSPSAVIDGTVRVPLVVWLHGAGDSGASNVSHPTLQSMADDLGGILAVPTAPTTCDWSASDSCAALVHGTVQAVKRAYPVDDDRVYITGFSMGGRGSYTDGLTWPDMFAGVVPVAGTIGACHGTLDLDVHRDYVYPHVENAEHQRVRLITGLLDLEYLVAQNEAAAGVFDELGYDFEWDPLEGVGHAFPTAEWTTAMTWVSGHSRDPYPVEVLYNMALMASSYYDNLYMNSSLRTNVYWLRIERRASNLDPARMEGSIEGQTVTVATTNISEVSVYLADELLDLDLPVTIVVNGGLWHEGVVARDPVLALEHARERLERTMVFAARIQGVVP